MNTNPFGSLQVAAGSTTSGSTGSRIMLPDGPPDALSEELPPAYTAMADVRQGEQSVEFGPARPFQQPPARPAQQSFMNPLLNPPPPTPETFTPWRPAPISHRPVTSGWQSAWGGYPGQVQRSTTTVTRNRASSNSNSPRRPPPPPQHPTLLSAREYSPAFNSNRPFYAPPSRPPPPQHHNTVQSSSQPQLRDQTSLGPPPPTPPRPASDFARDFYIAGADDYGLLGGASQQYEALPSPTNQRGPPTTTPPRPRSAPSGDSPNAPHTPAQPAIPDDGRPTTMPVPGHPLLNNGKVLVYPAGHECNKCDNTGYKHFDPSHPCTKCWSKYAKPYSGPVAYAPWSSTGDVTPSRAGTNLQRPLRALQSPAGPSLPPPFTSSSTGQYAPPPQHAALTRSGSLYAPSYLPIAGGGMPLGPPDSSLYAGPSTQYSASAPPPGALVVQPGDSRIGGRVCWRCNGSGTVSLFFFDQQTCDVCDGIGRVR